jgi:hypothetical protein
VKPHFDIDRELKTFTSPYLFLALDLPPPPLFQDAVEKNIIPQVSIHSVLAKYDGKTSQESAGHLRRYKCQRLPPYIILHFKRFTKNAFVEEKNPTIVTFPLRGLDFKEYVDVPPNSISTLYDLIANVTHESVAGTTRDKENTVWKAHIRAAGGGGDNEKWFMIQDLIVEETRKEMIFLGETILQVLSLPFNFPNNFNVTPTDLGTSNRSTKTMTTNSLPKLFCTTGGIYIFCRYGDLISLCFLVIGNGFLVVDILAGNNPQIVSSIGKQRFEDINSREDTCRCGNNKRHCSSHCQHS